VANTLLQLLTELGVTPGREDMPLWGRVAALDFDPFNQQREQGTRVFASFVMLLDHKAYGAHGNKILEILT